MENATVIKEHEQYSISLSGDRETLLFSWNHIPGLTARDFANGITDFASLCVSLHPSRAVFDARQLDQESQAIHWLDGRGPVEGFDAYDTWWVRTVVPLYNEAGIGSLTVATGDPNAPGEIPTRDGAHFQMGYFTDVVAASNWPGP